jgi:hypothetical protein
MCLQDASQVLTTLTDVHTEEGQLRAIGADTVEALGIQPGLPLLLPQLHPADVTATVEEVLLQSPVGKKRREGIPEPRRAQLPPRAKASRTSSGDQERRREARS